MMVSMAMAQPRTLREFERPATRIQNSLRALNSRTRRSRRASRRMRSAVITTPPPGKVRKRLISMDMTDTDMMKRSKSVQGSQIMPLNPSGWRNQRVSHSTVKTPRKPISRYCASSDVSSMIPSVVSPSMRPLRATRTPKKPSKRTQSSTFFCAASSILSISNSSHSTQTPSRDSSSTIMKSPPLAIFSRWSLR